MSLCSSGYVPWRVVTYRLKAGQSRDRVGTARRCAAPTESYSTLRSSRHHRLTGNDPRVTTLLLPNSRVFASAITAKTQVACSGRPFGTRAMAVTTRDWPSIMAQRNRQYATCRQNGRGRLGPSAFPRSSSGDGLKLQSRTGLTWPPAIAAFTTPSVVHVARSLP